VHEDERAEVVQRHVSIRSTVPNIMRRTAGAAAMASMREKPRKVSTSR
jgi:hypothetical protein